MSSIAQVPILVFGGRQLTVEPRLELGRKKLDPDGFCGRLGGLAGRRDAAGYVNGSIQGQLAPAGTCGEAAEQLRGTTRRGAVVLSGGSRSRCRCGFRCGRVPPRPDV
ncbi:hypothetical protein GCM10010371_31390 [Streptomyces subrutilus]|uniref:Uncharacterized protein n=1 Tax=Streptomyces subrutilus TaxID=36818 RepID=A0A918V4L9_9ACTN|nr:hypothetical protein GCM10010371_31390 [Streptomyces subrutilus]